MSVKWVIFVEGRDDECFIRCLLLHLKIADVETEVIGGGVSKLPSVAPQIVRYKDAGNRIAVVLDANSNFRNRRSEYLKMKNQLSLPVDRSFLLPNGQDPGCLETLLEKIAIPQYRDVYNCFDDYETCLQRHGTYNLPNRKARIYAYCEALNIKTNASKRNYNDPLYWNLNASALDPLRQFLLAL